MRNDIKELVKLMLKEETKINYAAIVRQYEVDYRTIKRYAKMNKKELSRGINSYSLLDPFMQIIEGKLENSCTAKSIYYFIKKKGFKGSYSLVKNA